MESLVANLENILEIPQYVSLFYLYHMARPRAATSLVVSDFQQPLKLNFNVLALSKVKNIQIIYEI